MRLMQSQPSDKTKTSQGLVAASVCADPLANIETAVQPVQRRHVRDGIPIDDGWGQTERPIYWASSTLPGPSSHSQTRSTAKQKPTEQSASV